MSSRHIKSATRSELLISQQYRCAFCLKQSLLDFHHIKYYSEGGSNSFDNLILLCPSCHALIHRLPGYFIPKDLLSIKKRNLKVIKFEKTIYDIKSERDLVLLDKYLLNYIFRTELMTIGCYSYLIELFTILKKKLIDLKTYSFKEKRKFNLKVVESILFDLKIHDKTINLDYFNDYINSISSLSILGKDFYDSIFFNLLYSSLLNEINGTYNKDTLNIASSYIRDNNQSFINHLCFRHICLELGKGYLQKAYDHFSSMARMNDNNEYDIRMHQNLLSVYSKIKFRSNKRYINNAVKDQILGLKKAIKIFHKRGMYFRAKNIVQFYSNINDFDSAFPFIRLARTIGSCNPIGNLKSDWQLTSIENTIREKIGNNDFDKILSKSKIPIIEGSLNNET